MIPISALHGDNLVEPSANLSWYSGWLNDASEGIRDRTVIDAIDVIYP